MLVCNVSLRPPRSAIAADLAEVAAALDAPGTGNCPKDAGVDKDFASAPNEFSIPGRGTVIGGGQKNGVYTVFDADNGSTVEG
jgi:hypothetical protein